MNRDYINEMAHKLGPVLNDKLSAEQILARYWSDKIALVWEVDDVFRAANELKLALTKSEAIKVLKELHHHHNAQFGLKWEDLTAYIKDHVLGRKLNKREVRMFVAKDILTHEK